MEYNSLIANRENNNENQHCRLLPSVQIQRKQPVYRHPNTLPYIHVSKACSPIHTYMHRRECWTIPRCDNGNYISNHRECWTNQSILTIEPAILLGFHVPMKPRKFLSWVPRLILNLESQNGYLSLVHMFQLVCLLRIEPSQNQCLRP